MDLGVQNRVFGVKTGFWGSPEAVLIIFLRDLGSKTASGSSKRRPPVRPPKKLPKGFTVDNLGPFRGYLDVQNGFWTFWGYSGRQMGYSKTDQILSKILAKF